jgi:hypothetical protein
MSNYTESIIRQIILQFDANDDICWNEDKNGNIYAFVKCNDFFWWGTSDGEQINYDDILSVIRAYKDVGAETTFGGLLWCARKRKMRPQGAFYKHISKEIRPLFDGCGPERSIDLFNPKKQEDE